MKNVDLTGHATREFTRAETGKLQGNLIQTIVDEFVEEERRNSSREEYYLAHSLATRKEIREWELGFEERTRILLRNPFYDIERDDIKKLDNGEKFESDLPTVVVERDLTGLRECKDGLVVFIDKGTSVGSLQEMVYGHLLRRAIYSIITDGREKHPWLVYHSDKIFTTPEKFEEWMTDGRYKL